MKNDAVDGDESDEEDEKAPELEQIAPAGAIVDGVGDEGGDEFHSVRGGSREERCGRKGIIGAVKTLLPKSGRAFTFLRSFDDYDGSASDLSG